MRRWRSQNSQLPTNDKCFNAMKQNMQECKLLKAAIQMREALIRTGEEN
jgi:hypothetical protein